MDHEGNHSICNFPTATDVLTQILVRLPPNDRRRLRLVCRFWRAVVDQRTATDMRRRTKVLAATTSGSTYVVDVLSPGSPTVPWQCETVADYVLALSYGAMRVVGTCNGLVCLCDDREPGGAITLANPATGEALRLPPLPTPSTHRKVERAYRKRRRNWHKTYIFVYHPTTGHYKVVHVPCQSDPFWRPDTVHVFTLGEASWRDVQAGPDARCSLVDVDGTVYWMTEEEDAGKVVAFDLENERVMRTEQLPVPVKTACCRLTKVHARLGVAVSDNDELTVWVLEGDSWSRRYVLEEPKLRMQQLVVPYFALGDYVLTYGWSGTIYRHKMNGAPRSQGEVGVVRIECDGRGESLACLTQPIYRMFAYVETNKSLSAYRAGSATRPLDDGIFPSPVPA